jgi:hypothetical protein
MSIAPAICEVHTEGVAGHADSKTMMVCVLLPIAPDDGH